MTEHLLARHFCQPSNRLEDKQTEYLEVLGKMPSIILSFYFGIKITMPFCR